MRTARSGFGVNGACVHEGILPFHLSLNSTSFILSLSAYSSQCARKPHLPQESRNWAISQAERGKGPGAIPHGHVAGMVLR